MLASPNRRWRTPTHLVVADRGVSEERRQKLTCSKVGQTGPIPAMAGVDSGLHFMIVWQHLRRWVIASLRSPR
jgi:hypothetical protein